MQTMLHLYVGSTGCFIFDVDLLQLPRTCLTPAFAAAARLPHTCCDDRDRGVIGAIGSPTPRPRVNPVIPLVQCIAVLKDRQRT